MVFTYHYLLQVITMEFSLQGFHSLWFMACMLIYSIAHCSVIALHHQYALYWKAIPYCSLGISRLTAYILPIFTHYCLLISHTFAYWVCYFSYVTYM